MRLNKLDINQVDNSNQQHKIKLKLMGITQTRNEEQISQVIKQEYLIQNNQNLLHKKTQEPCTLHKITTTSQAQSDLINRNITAYQQSRCNSISRLREHYHIQNGGYCSDDENFYLIFYGQDSPSAREEYLARRDAGSRFSAFEIENILAAMLSGLREYCKRFNRGDCRVGLQSVGINIFNKNKLYLKQPWLSLKTNSSSQSSIGLCTSYPSPQKLQSAFTITSDYDEFRSDLFTIGMNGLQLAGMSFRDDVYTTKKFVDRQRIIDQLNMVKDGRLRSGLQILLHENPLEREKIYGFWRVLDENQYCLPFLETMEKQKKMKVYSKHPHHVQPHYPQNFFRNPSVQSSRTYNPLTNTQQTSNTQQTYHTQTYKAQPPPTAFLKPSQSKPVYEEATVVSKPIAHKGYVSNDKQVSFNKPFPQNNIPLKQSIETPTFEYQTPGFRSQFSSQFAKFNPTLTTNNFLPVTGSFQANQSMRDNTVHTSIEHPDALRDDIQKYIKVVQQQLAQESPIKDPNQQQPQSKQEQPEEKKVEQKQQTTTQLITHNQIKIEQQAIPPLPIPETLQYKAQPLLNQQKRQPSIEQEQTQNQPESPSTISLERTIPQLTHKYNSTIVEVNEETPNESQEEQENEQEHKYEFLVEEYETGSRYEGYKKDGVRNGRGKFFYQDGGYYDGEWKNNQMHGWGKLYYEGGKLAYEGNWAHDEFHGYGKVYNDNPVLIESYNGFDYTNFDMLDDYWEYYEGLLSRDTKEGRGKIQLSNGEMFEGDFHNDRIQGFGKFTKLDGLVIEGIWRDSRLIKVLTS